MGEVVGDVMDMLSRRQTYSPYWPGKLQAVEMTRRFLASRFILSASGDASPNPEGYPNGLGALSA